MNPVLAVVLGWLGINVAVGVAAWLARDREDHVDVHDDILDRLRRD